MTDDLISGETALAIAVIVWSGLLILALTAAPGLVSTWYQDISARVFTPSLWIWGTVMLAVGITAEVIRLGGRLAARRLSETDQSYTTPPWEE